jgi:hypothetical protein
MRKVISKLLVLALVAGICNAQDAPQRPERPQRPVPQPQAEGGAARPVRPGTNALPPSGPTRQQQAITRAPGAPTRPVSQAPNGNKPNRPLPGSELRRLL